MLCRLLPPNRSTQLSTCGASWLLGVVAIGAAGCRQAPAHPASPPVAVGYGVDTTVADVGAVVRLVTAYLAAPDSTARSQRFWSVSDSLDRRAGDLAAPFGFYDAPAVVVGVLSVPPGDSVYAIRIQYTRTDTTRGDSFPIALQRVYALRAPGTPYGWQLSNALPRHTRDWQRLTVGRIVFYYAPGQRPDSARAMGAARFVDSIGTLFGVSPRPRIHYFVTSSPEEYQRAWGLDFFPLPSGPGSGRGGQGGLLPGTDEGLVLSGDPTQGEAYFHELTHTVLGGRLGGGRFLAEGVATWLGGSKGHARTTLYTKLAQFLQSHPETSFGSLLRGEIDAAGEGARIDAAYASGALVIDAIYRRAGVAGLRALRSAPDAPEALERFIQLQLGLPLDDDAALERWWRSAARASAAHSSSSPNASAAPST